MKKDTIAGAAIPAKPLAKRVSSVQKTRKTKFVMSSVHLTQQDFVSTFPWGLRGDKVRILQQEVENELLDAETAAAMAFMLGFESSSERLDETWKLLLNSQNHDVHVCCADETGIAWCNQARQIIAGVREKACEFIAGCVGGPAIALNTLSWPRTTKTGMSVIPAFGYAVTEPAQIAGETDKKGNRPWNGWFEAEAFRIRLREDGSMEASIGPGNKNMVLFGHLTLQTQGKTLDSRDAKPVSMESWISPDSTKAFAEIKGRIHDFAFTHEISVTKSHIDMETTFDYGNGCFFGPEITDFEEEPRRTHYFQHERKLCMNCEFPDTRTKLLYNSPFLTWPTSKSRSIESLHYAVLQSENYGIAHFNIGQSGYGYIEKDSVCRHVLAFAPQKYIYGKAEKLVLKGQQSHRCRFMPYRGDWRKANLPLRASEYQRPIITLQSNKERTALPLKASLVQIDSNSTIATALFERGGRLFVRLWEWAGQKDRLALTFGDEKATFRECTHNLKDAGKIDAFFTMRPWEIKTIELIGTPKPLEGSNRCSKAKSFRRVPQGWLRRNYFETSLPRTRAASRIAKDAVIYFSSGYHDGCVKPLEKHTPTMALEMQRVRSPHYPGYTSTWEIGGSCWVSINKNEPEYFESLKPFLKDGSIELVGGTWSAPLSLVISGESNIRQFMHGLEATEKYLDIKISVYMNQEHGTFAQMPQILKSFGLKAVVNRTQWAPYGYESGIDAEAAKWIGADGSSITIIPRYNSMNYKNCPWDDRNLQNGSITGHNRVWRTKEKFREMRNRAIAHGVNRPLMTMLEDIWSPDLCSSDEEMAFYASLPFVRFTSIARYLAMFGVRI